MSETPPGMSTSLFRDLTAGSRVAGPCLCLRRTLARGRGERAYLVLSLADRGGVVDARLWDKAEEALRRFSDGDLVSIEGTSVVYQGRVQIHLSRIERADDPSLRAADFMPVADRAADAMWRELVELARTVRDEALEALLAAVLGDEAIAEALCRCPGGKSIHHAFVGGLLQHTLSVAKLVDLACGHYEKEAPGLLDRDLALTAAILHDIGKTRELSWEGGFDYTDRGRLLGHIVLGDAIVEEKIRAIPDFPEETALRLRHVLIAHHGEQRLGSPRDPMTAEAFVVHHADALDCQLGYLRGLFAREETARWTSYQELYGRYFLRGAPPSQGWAAADADEGGPSEPASGPATAAPTRTR